VKLLTPSIDAAQYSSIGQYFYDLLTPALEPNGQRKDRFSFISTNKDADSLTSGTITAYGVRWETDGQGRQRAAFVETGSPAEAAGLTRGAQLVEILTPGTPDWYPNTGTTISFTWRPAPDQPTRNAIMNSAVISEDPVPLVRTFLSRKDNCGLSYFPIEFQGTNALGFGDYASGFAPTCPAADDFDHALGAADERLLATAMHHIDHGSCPEQAAVPQQLRNRVPVRRAGHLLPGKLIRRSE
jgi:hypothetical protein